MTKKNKFQPKTLIGFRFGKLLVIDIGIPIIDGGRQKVSTSVCLCDCGKKVTIRNYVLTRKKSPANSCGCTRKHGESQRDKRSRTYRAWQDMKTRCKRDPRYIDVNICNSWIESYENFRNDMGECPENMTLDRINPYGNYEPSNCRWATAKEQQNNRRNNHLITVGNETKTVSEWMDYYGLDKTTFYRRLKLGWTPEQAAGTPKLARHKRWNRKYEI